MREHTARCKREAVKLQQLRLTTASSDDRIDTTGRQDGPPLVGGHEMVATESLTLSGGLVVVIGAPPGTAVSLDGVTRVTPPETQAQGGGPTPAGGLFLIGGVPSSGFHLLSVRCGASATSHGRGAGSLPVGFVVAKGTDDCSISSSDAIASDFGYHWVLARRYDPRTEEMSAEDVDGPTLRNIIGATRDGGELSRFVMTYDQFMSAPASSASSRGGEYGKGAFKDGSILSWQNRTSLINEDFLLTCHGLKHGEKVVPSSDGEHSSDSNQQAAAIEDGKSLAYPSIPCIDGDVPARHLMKHTGTRLYLSKLPPDVRTWLISGVSSGGNFSAASPEEFVWSAVVSSEEYFLADIALSFEAFLFLHCQSSMEHWRDAVAMCSLSAEAMVTRHPRFYLKLMSTIRYQIACIEADFFHDVEYSSGEGNFIVQALKRLCGACDGLNKRKRQGDDSLDKLKVVSQNLKSVTNERFGLNISGCVAENDLEEEDLDNVVDTIAYGEANEMEQDDEMNILTRLKRHHSEQMMQEDDTDSDEDGPVVLDYCEVESSLARSGCSAPRLGGKHKQAYPLLYAAMTEGEDEVMACARILDLRQDVSLVREAAAYLEQVEAHK